MPITLLNKKKSTNIHLIEEKKRNNRNFLFTVVQVNIYFFDAEEKLIKHFWLRNINLFTLIIRYKILLLHIN